MPEQATAIPVTTRLLFAIYDVAVEVIVWLALVPWAAWMLGRGQLSSTDIREWLGRTTPRRSSEPCVIVHAVSAGEASSAVAFIEALIRERPSWRVVMTVGNRDARAIAMDAAQRTPAITTVVRLPWDRCRALVRWLRQWTPAAVIVVEPEFWPGLYRACGALDIPLFLVNARVYPRDVSRYRLVRPFMRAVLAQASWIGAQSEDAAASLRAIGADTRRIDITGNLKFDGAERSSAVARHVSDRHRGGRRIIVAGSTHAADEAIVLEALAALRTRHADLGLVIAPRHVARAPEALEATRSRGFISITASQVHDSSAHWDVLVLDTMGDLAAVYAAGDIAIVGGTLGHHGGHNVAEPARAGVPVIVGPSVGHIQDMVDRLDAAGAIVRLLESTPEALDAACEQLLDDTPHRHAIGARARQCYLAEAGASSRSVSAVIAVVEGRADAGSVSAPGLSPGASAKWQLGANGAES